MSNYDDLRGFGFWYDCQTRRYVAIHDHTLAVAADPARFRVSPATVRGVRAAGSTGPAFERARARVIPKVAAQGFIRVRYLPQRGTLGFEFSTSACLAHGVDPYRVLGAFCRKHEIGELTAVCITDFDLPYTQTTRWTAAAAPSKTRRATRAAVLRLVARRSDQSVLGVCLSLSGAQRKHGTAAIDDLVCIGALTYHTSARLLRITDFGRAYLRACELP